MTQKPSKPYALKSERAAGAGCVPAGFAVPFQPERTVRLRILVFADLHAYWKRCSGCSGPNRSRTQCFFGTTSWSMAPARPTACIGCGPTWNTRCRAAMITGWPTSLAAAAHRGARPAAPGHVVGLPVQKSPALGICGACHDFSGSAPSTSPAGGRWSHTSQPPLP